MSDYSSICLACKKRVPYGDPYNEMFCDDCGSQIVSVCPKCRKAIASETAAFCRYCSSHLLGEEKP